MAVKTYQDSKDKYLKEKVDTFVLRVPKGKKDEIMEYAKSRGMSLNGYITELIFADMGLTDSKPTTNKIEKPKKAAPKKKAEPKPAPVKEEIKETVQTPVVETPAEEVETEVKKKKMPSFLL